LALVEVNRVLYAVGGYKPKHEKMSRTLLRLENDAWVKCDVVLPFHLKSMSVVRTAGSNVIIAGGSLS
jgi:hypothetical protein